LTFAFVGLLAVTCLAAIDHSDDVDMKVPKGWKVRTHAENHKTQSVVIDMIPEGDDKDNWTQLIYMQSGATPRSVHSPEEMLNALKAQEEKDCPGLTEWSEITRDTYSITYSRHKQPCGKNPEEMHLSKILVGKRTVYLVSYIQKAKEFSPEDRETWLKYLGEITFINKH
jgi:hypothetical protein